MPDMVTLAKALGGGMPVGAIGGSEEVMSVVEDGSVFQVGTYNGNPLGMAAARANLTEVLTPEAYQHLDALNERILRGCSDVIERYGLSGYSVGVGSKGCVTFSPAKIVDYETFKENQDAELADLAWLFNMNRGIFMTPGPRGGVDALGDAHRRVGRSLRRHLRRDGARSDSVMRARARSHRHAGGARRCLSEPLSRAGARPALPGPRHGAAQPPARRAQPQQAGTSCCGWRTGSSTSAPDRRSSSASASR